MTDTVSRYRRWVAAGLAGLAALTALTALAPRQQPTEQIWVAARDLPGGVVLTAAELRVESLPRQFVPAGALAAARSPVGRTLGPPARTGQPLTDLDLLGDRLIQAVEPGAVAVPVHLADAAAATGIVQAGQHVDVVSAAAPAGAPEAAAVGRVVARALPVLAPPVADSADAGAVAVLAATRRQAVALAAAAATGTLSMILTAPG